MKHSNLYLGQVGDRASLKSPRHSVNKVRWNGETPSLKCKYKTCLKNFPLTNALAYFALALATKKKSFTMFVIGGHKQT